MGKEREKVDKVREERLGTGDKKGRKRDLRKREKRLGKRKEQERKRDGRFG